MGSRRVFSSERGAGRRPWTYRGDVSPWFSFVAAAVTTVGVFAGAFASMTSLRRTHAPAIDPVAAISVSLAVQPPIRVPSSSPQPTPRRPARASAITSSPSTPDSGSSQNSIARDTATAAQARANDPTAASIPRGVAMPSLGNSGTGPAYAPAWIAAGTRLLGPAGSAKLRDSISDALKPAAEARAWARPISAGTRAEIDESPRQTSILDRRAATAGNSRDVHTTSGQGVGGVGAIGVGGSVGVPLFSRGPSAAQRARDAKIDADNRAIMQRLAERARAKRDSIRRDSIRADSARNATAARRPS